MTNLFEQFTAELNEHFFLSEYSFSKNQFRAISGQELELADHLISTPDALFVFQLKERDSGAAVDEDSLERWFRGKVLQNGCGQIADSVRFLKEQSPLLVTNQRGHSHDLANPGQPVLPIILYSCGTSPPASIRATKHRMSERAGFVHVIWETDYYHLCRTLALPSELTAYFGFRQGLLLGCPEGHWEEAEIVAQFIADSHDRLPKASVKRILQEAAENVSSFDLSWILRRFGEKVAYFVGSGNDLDYYRILDEFSRLSRAEMRGFKRLLTWALDTAGSAEAQKPARMKTTKGTGFVVIPIHQGAFETRLDALNNFSVAAKYDWRINRQIGLSVARDGLEVELDWYYIDDSWEQNEELESVMNNEYPFRQTPEPQVEYRYPSSPEEMSE